MLLLSAIEMFRKHLQSKERSKQTVRGYTLSLREFNNYITRELNGQVYLDEVQVKHLEAFLAFRKDKGDQPVSRNRMLYIFRSFYAFLFRQEIIEVDISQRLEPIKLQMKERMHLSLKEVEELLSAIEHPLIQVAGFGLAYTGLRVSELCNLTLKDIDLKKGLLKVREGKGKKDRTVPISGKLNDILSNYLKCIRPTIDSEFFFATSKTGKLSPAYINYCLNETTEKLGWEKHVTAHILRHSFASNLVRNKASLPAVQNLLGHSDLRVTSRYIHQNMDELETAVNLI